MMVKMIRGCRKIAKDSGALENDPEGDEGCPWTMEPLEERAYVQIRFRLSLVTRIYNSGLLICKFQQLRQVSLPIHVLDSCPRQLSKLV